MVRRRRAPARARALYSRCAHISSQQRRYHYGGGHGILLRLIKPNLGLDCSSSTSLALDREGMLPGEYAKVSWQFARWGVPGKGKWFTLWWNRGHVWIEFHGLGRFRRFDTSPWGYGGRGPRMRMTPRSTRGFYARHWPGL